MNKKVILLVGLVAGLLWTTGCAPQSAQQTIFAMDTVMTLEVWGSDSETALEEAAARINELDRTLSVSNEKSDIWAVNHEEGAVTVSADTAVLIETGLSLWEETGGALNIAMYPVVRSWGFTTGEYRVVDEQERRQLLECTDLSLLEFDAETRTVTTPTEMQLDLGSLGKGYAGDQVMELFRGRGIESAIISLGGNVQTLGTRPDGDPWRIGIQDPEDQESYLGVLEVADLAVVTSGGYERYFEENGQIYWHIMDPATGAPADSGVISATVVGQSGTLCDGLSTALFVMGVDRAAEYWREHDGFDFLLVDEEGTLWLTEGLEDCFIPADESRTMEVIHR